MTKNDNLESFEWPKFKNDRERIRYNSNHYANWGMAEAFADAFGLTIKGITEDMKEYVDSTPKDLAIGELIDVKIRDVNKNHVEFDSLQAKTNLESSVNLFKYKRFKNNTPKETVKGRVMSSVRGTTYIDVLSPLTESYIGKFIDEPWRQKDLKKFKTITIKNLQLSKGGFLGQAVIPTTSEFVGEDYTVEAFIPGSQIVLNIADNFEDFIGQTVEAFVVNYIPKPKTDNKMSLICSVKELLKADGEKNMIDIFKHWTENDEEWNAIESCNFEGVVTGIINSSKKCGVFVEIPELNVTGMVELPVTEIVNYKPKDVVKVKIDGFEEITYYNKDMDQTQHIEPYVITDGCIEKCNLKPILKF